MLKNKTVKRLLNNIVCAGLLLTTLPVSLPLNSQPLPEETTQQTMQQERLEKEVEQKIDYIRSINWRLKAVQIGIPGTIIGGGAVVGLITILVSWVVEIFAVIPKIKTHPKKITKKFWGKRPNLYLAISILEALGLPPALGTLVGLITSALLWGTGLAAIIAKVVFRITTTSVEKAFTYADELTQFEKAKLITLSPEQKAVIEKLKKRQKSPIIQGIIKNLRLNATRKKLVNTAMVAQFSFVMQLVIKKKMSNKKIRKLFAKYIKTRWNEKDLQKQAAELATMKEATKLKASNAKRLNKAKNKIEKLETQYPGLRAALSEAVDDYSDKANKMLQELKKDVVEALKRKDVKIPPAPQPIPF